MTAADTTTPHTEAARLADAVKASGAGGTGPARRTS